MIYRRVNNPAADDLCTLFIYDLTTQKSSQLLPDEDVDCYASFSPSGTEILFVTNKNPQFKIIIFDIATGEISRIPIDGHSLFPWCSTKREKILIEVNKDNDLLLYQFSWRTKQIGLIAELGPFQKVREVSWSPDGKKVLFNQYEPSMSYEKRLRLLDINTGQITDLYRLQGQAIDPHETDYVWDYDPTWSPDGKYFAYRTMDWSVSSWELNNKRKIFLNIQSVETLATMQIEIPNVSLVSWTYPTK